MKLHKSLCGQVEAPWFWCDKSSEGSQACGLKPSAIDPCLFVSDKVIAAVHVDDVVFFA